MVHRLAAVFLLTVASLGFALRFRPPPSQVDDIEEILAVEVVASTAATSTSTYPTYAPIPSVTTTTVPPLPPGVQQFESAIVRFGRGLMQLEITLELGELVDVEMIRTPSSSERAKSINIETAPILAAEAIELQGYRLHVISGATETSFGYMRALRDAFEQADLCARPKCELPLR